MTPIQPREKRIVPGMSTPVEFGVIYDVFFPFADKESEVWRLPIIDSLQNQFHVTA